MILYDKETMINFQNSRFLPLFLLGVTLATAKLLLSLRNKRNNVKYHYFL